TLESPPRRRGAPRRAGPPKPPKRSGRPGEAVAPLDARGPPTPPTLGPPRRSRGVPRRAGPRNPPNVRVAPAKPWRLSTWGASKGPPTPQTFGAPGVNPGAPLPPPSIRRAGAVVPSRHEIDRLRDHRRFRALAARGPDRRRRPVR